MPAPRQRYRRKETDETPEYDPLLEQEMMMHYGNHDKDAVASVIFLRGLIVLAKLVLVVGMGWLFVNGLGEMILDFLRFVKVVLRGELE